MKMNGDDGRSWEMEVGERDTDARFDWPFIDAVFLKKDGGRWGKLNSLLQFWGKTIFLNGTAG
jgi:hypothetical protein